MFNNTDLRYDAEFIDKIITDIVLYRESSVNTQSKKILLFPPFSSKNRFIIHNIVREKFPDTTTFSVGLDLMRRVAVCKKEYLIKDIESNNENYNNVSINIKSENENETIEKKEKKEIKNKPKYLAMYIPPPARTSSKEIQISQNVDRNLMPSKKSNATIVEKSKCIYRDLYVPPAMRRAKEVEILNESDGKVAHVNKKRNTRKTTRLCLNIGSSCNNEESNKICNNSFLLFNDEIEDDSPLQKVQKIKTQKLKVDLINKQETYESNQSYLTNSDHIKYNNTNNSNSFSILELSNNTKIEHESIDAKRNSENLENSFFNIPTSCNNLEVSDEVDMDTNDNNLSNLVTNSPVSINNCSDDFLVDGSKLSAISSCQTKNIEIDFNSELTNNSEYFSTNLKGENECKSITLSSLISKVDFSDDENCSEIIHRNDSFNKEDFITLNQNLSNITCGINNLKYKIEEKLSEENTPCDISSLNVVHNSDVKDNLSDINSEKVTINEKKQSSILIKTHTPIRFEEDSNDRNVLNDWKFVPENSELDDVLHEISDRVGKINVKQPKNSYKEYEFSIDDNMFQGNNIIEAYNFPKEFKTEDMIILFNFCQIDDFYIKWVDDTHALIVFSNPFLANEVLKRDLDIVKTRHLALATAKSKQKASGLPLPRGIRPKTCPSLARRLVSSALGIKSNVSKDKLKAEQELLQKEKEKKKNEAKSLEEPWEGEIV